MVMQTVNTSARINKLKGEILAHAMPVEVLGITGQQKKMPKNSSKHGFVPSLAAVRLAAIANPNQWAVDVLKHIVQEGVTPAADTLTPQDIEVQMQQYAVLYAVTDQMVDMHEDGPAIVDEMKKQTGERLGLVRELVRYGALKGCTNKFYAGGTSRSTVSARSRSAAAQDDPRPARQPRQVHHRHPGADRRTSAPPPSKRRTWCSRTPTSSRTSATCRASRKPRSTASASRSTSRSWAASRTSASSCRRNCESVPDSRRSVGATGLYSTSGANVDVYPVIVPARTHGARSPCAARNRST
jgi:hypothetical protein